MSEEGIDKSALSPIKLESPKATLSVNYNFDQIFVYVKMINSVFV